MKTSKIKVGRLVPLLALLALAPLALLSCVGAGDEPGSPTGPVTQYTPDMDYTGATITVKPSSTRLTPGDTFTVVATFRDATGAAIAGAPLAISSEAGAYLSTPVNPSTTGDEGKVSFLVAVSSSCPEGSYVIEVYSSPAEPLSGPTAKGSFGIKVTQDAETVSTPSAPTGNATPNAGIDTTFNASGASSSYDHAIQYQFQWGDGNASAWVDADSANQATSSHTYDWTCVASGSVSYTYQVTLKARCASDTSIVSAISSALSVTVTKNCP